MDPLISVVIPVYKAEPYVAACLESVLNQTYRKLEVIAVNDCTPDASMRIVARYASADPRIRVLENERNMGSMQTRERGYREARGTFVFFLDADDTIRPQTIERLLQLQQGTGADIVAGAFVYHKRDGAQRNISAALPFGDTAEATLRAMLRGNFPLSMCAKLIRRSLLTDHAYQVFPHMIISEDCCMLFQLVARAARIACMDSPVYDCTDNEASSTHQTFTLSHVENILTTRRVMCDICAPYPSLANDLDRNITFTVLRLYCYPFPKATLRKLIAQYGLSRYGSWCHGWKVLSLRQFVGTYISALIKRQA